MRFFRIAGVIVLAALAIGLGGAIFQSGYLAGVAADGGAPVVVAPGYGWGFGWGFGGGLFHLLGTLFFILLFIGILRAAFGGRHRREWGAGPRAGWGHGDWGPGGPDGGHRFGPWEDRAREVHDEWHRREAAGGTGASASSAGTAGGGSTPGGSGA